jgi:hypothetical protein
MESLALAFEETSRDIAVRTRWSAIALLRLRCTFQKIDRLSDMIQRLLNWPLILGACTNVCCYCTQAVIQNLGRCTELFAFVSRHARPVHAQLFGERGLRPFASCELD